MTTLEAINYALKRCGLSVASALETGTSSAVGEMERFLDEVNLEVQSENWHFNRRTDVRVSPNTAGKILLAITGSVTGISVANPTVITCTAHGLSDGDTVLFASTNSTPVLVGPYVVTKVDANSFTVPVNVTGSGNTGTFSTWGGTIIEIDCSDEDRNVVAINDRLYDLDNNTDIFTEDVDIDFTLQMAWSLIPPKVQQYIAAQTAVAYNDSKGMSERAGVLRDNAKKCKVRARAADARTADVNLLSTQGVANVRGNRLSGNILDGE